MLFISAVFDNLTIIITNLILTNNSNFMGSCMFDAQGAQLVVMQNISFINNTVQDALG